MRIFLITLLVSIAATIVLWSFGLARWIWPAHPVFMTTVIAMGFAMATQLKLTYDRDRQRGRK